MDEEFKDFVIIKKTYAAIIREPSETEENEEVEVDDEFDDEELEEEDEFDDLDEDKNLGPPLIAAVVACDYAMVRSLLDEGADKNYVDKQGCSAMFHAAFLENVLMMQILVEHGVFDKADRFGVTSLIIAAVFGYGIILKALLAKGVGLEQADSNGHTAFFVSARTGNLQFVQYLVEQGADMEKVDSRGDSALFVACGSRACGSLDVVRYLLEQGVDRDKTNNKGWTPLHHAAIACHLDIAKLLMSYGANLNARNLDGQLPIDMTRNEAIKQAIRDEPRRRMDEAPGKRTIDQDRKSNENSSANAQKDDDEEEEQRDEEQATFLAEINEDSEPSDDEDD